MATYEIEVLEKDGSYRVAAKNLDRSQFVAWYELCEKTRIVRGFKVIGYERISDYP